MRIRLESIGCRLNEAELQHWARQFRALGHEPCHNDSAAERTADAPIDLVVVNTCAVTQEAVRKSRQLLRRMQRYNPYARLIVSGCATALDRTEVDLSGIDLLVSNADKDRLVEIAQQELALPIMPATAETEAAALFARGRQRAFVKIQDGCRYQCTFCVTTLARGPERSRPLTEIVTEVQTAAASGIKEAVLTGVQIAGYGAGHGDGLEELIQAVLNDTEIPRLRLGSVEPWGLGERFWRLFENPRLAPHLHLPLQSGSDRILRRMARRCTTAAYRELVTQARAAIRDFNLTTDIIIGFPGETEADWQQTLTLVAEIGFSHLHSFSYSRRPGTQAATLPEQVPATVKRARMQQLQPLAERLKTEALRTYLGRTMPVLFEGTSSTAGDQEALGYTLNYLPVRRAPQERRRPEDSTWVNQIHALKLTGISADGKALLGSRE
ncbi:tRNA (N(6)-L-threonylcarbamoyladenosine(37)-C(2))-methylthiotransferase MtaB [Rhabdochromatium marinum]|uniref:tRNA (N(6)-L-threonylcarbamoyladenosine(37)-C(2))- methylthiotransferase MtaB n=1 Tax=Rhabdochromatium marinum TaxID=48729 RepID=UPI001904913F|nr:tRNA (N(6)-L-threonylcarbamoyladenosine(37)-C(2))-methylthiotransferase MtaB [Rhabdochromatium marinum]MBK1647865.1 tRNA (N(6)-L-threonylcarbamoyladenosine(37)-C(2))-methylthiotransferase MtaB [Rhabdochromatium marinum]